jgi:Domain of unknown function (DUF4157)
VVVSLQLIFFQPKIRSSKRKVMKYSKKALKGASSSTPSNSSEGFEARTNYPVQLREDPVEQVRSAAAKVSNQDLSGFKVETNSSMPDSMGALATIQRKTISLSPSVSDLSKPANQEVLAHEFGHAKDQISGIPATGSINGTPVNTDPKREAHADRIAATTMQHL